LILILQYYDIKNKNHDIFNKCLLLGKVVVIIGYKIIENPKFIWITGF
jgi:hypothetical protein